MSDTPFLTQELTAASQRPPQQAAPVLVLQGVTRSFGTPPETLEIFRNINAQILPGEIVVSEGEPGDSLFILTSGLVRTYVRQPGGRNEQVRELKDGDFFGEISLLSGLPRSATITAATRCDLLEMDRPTLDSILQSHPRVMSVLEQFALERAGQGA